MSAENEATYTIQEAAQRTGVSAHTLRYYERIGLLTPIRRAANSGHRRYSEDNLRLVQFLLRLRTTGMPIAQRQLYIALLLEGNGTLDARLTLLKDHREVVCARMAELETDLAAIDYKIANSTRLTLENTLGSTDCPPKETPK